MAISAGSPIVYTDLKSKYDNFNSFINSFGGSIAKLTVPANSPHPVDDADINNLNGKINEFKNDTYLKTQSGWWVNKTVTAGNVAYASDWTNINTTISNFSKVKCRNQGTYNNTTKTHNCSDGQNSVNCSHVVNSHNCSQGTRTVGCSYTTRNVSCSNVTRNVSCSYTTRNVSCGGYSIRNVSCQHQYNSNTCSPQGYHTNYCSSQGTRSHWSGSVAKPTYCNGFICWARCSSYSLPSGWCLQSYGSGQSESIRFTSALNCSAHTVTCTSLSGYNITGGNNFFSGTGSTLTLMVRCTPRSGCSHYPSLNYRLTTATSEWTISGYSETTPGLGFNRNISCSNGSNNNSSCSYTQKTVSCQNVIRTHNCSDGYHNHNCQDGKHSHNCSDGKHSHNCSDGKHTHNCSDGPNTVSCSHTLKSNKCTHGTRNVSCSHVVNGHQTFIDITCIKTTGTK